MYRFLWVCFWRLFLWVKFLYSYSTVLTVSTFNVKIQFWMLCSYVKIFLTFILLLCLLSWLNCLISSVIFLYILWTHYNWRIRSFANMTILLLSFVLFSYFFLSRIIEFHHFLTWIWTSSVFQLVILSASDLTVLGHIPRDVIYLLQSLQ